MKRKTITPATTPKKEVPLYVYIDPSVDRWLRRRMERNGRSKKAEVGRILKQAMLQTRTTTAGR